MGFSLPQKLKKLTQIAIHLTPSLKPPSKRSPAGGREVRGWRRARAGGGVCAAALCCNHSHRHPERPPQTNANHRTPCSPLTSAPSPLIPFLLALHPMFTARARLWPPDNQVLQHESIQHQRVAAECPAPGRPGPGQRQGHLRRPLPSGSPHPSSPSAEPRLPTALITKEYGNSKWSDCTRCLTRAAPPVY